MPKIIVLAGPPGSGKSSYSKNIIEIHENLPTTPWRISQDDQGKDGHHKIFAEALQLKADIIVDRMNFSKHQRDKYLHPAKMLGYETEIIVFHVPRQTCFERIMARKGHPTINGIIDVNYNPDNCRVCDTEKARQANSALDTFFTKYERVEDTEADKVTRLGWITHTGKSLPAIICDLDGTLCNIEHRLHHVKHEIKKHNRWDLFNKEIPNDKINEWCKELVTTMGCNHPIIFCSGRVDSSRKVTEDWLLKHGFEFTYGTDDLERKKKYRHLFMRHRSDFRQDYIIKEIILDFEILPRFQVLFAIDDRQQVVDMWRRRGITCLQCAEGDF